MSQFQTGFVAVIGRPNVGKSTLINTLMQEKVSIVSPKPQTTRNSINCILMGDNYQIILVDTPGIHKPKNKLGEYMMKSARDTMANVDCVLWVADLSTGLRPEDNQILKTLKTIKTPLVIALNKKDLASSKQKELLTNAIQAELGTQTILETSGKTGYGTEALISALLKHIPEGPMLYPEDYLTDQPERFVVSEMIREKAILQLQDEIPYGIGVEIVRITDREDKPITDIEANILCEKESHKGIVIGKKGANLKKIGSAAREEIEGLLGTQVNLKLWVKVREDWRNNRAAMRSLGYKLEK